MGKEEFHWFCDVMGGGFWAKLGFKISDGPQQSAQFLWPLTAPGTQQTGTNHSYSSIWIPTNTTVWARKSFIISVTSCRVDFGQNFSRSWKSVMATPQKSAQFLWPLTAPWT
jgi:hypothetical protein